MDAREIIQRFEDGVVYECGCEERGLHPAIQRSLLAGELSMRHLLRCPVHHRDMRIGQRELAAVEASSGVR